MIWYCPAPSVTAVRTGSPGSALPPSPRGERPPWCRSPYHRSPAHWPGWERVLERLWRPRFSWTRIRGESDVEGGRGHGSVEEGVGSCVGSDGGSPEGERSRRRRRGGWGGGLGARAAVEREPETGRGVGAARRVAGHGLACRRAYRRGVALAGLELGLKAQAGEPLAAELDAAKRHIGELSMEIELLRERARAAECRLPLATRRSRR